MTTYSISRNGQQLGTFDVGQVAEGLRTGGFSASDWAWAEGMAEWKTLAELFPGEASVPVVVPVQMGAPAPAAAVPRPVPGMVKRPAGSAQPVRTVPGQAAKMEAARADASGAVAEMVVTELVGTRPWVRLISVLMWIACAVIVIRSLIMVFGLILAGASAEPEHAAVAAGVFFGGMIFLLVTGFLVIYPALKLTKYASRITQLAQSRSLADLTAALAEQRRYWKFLGIIMLVYVVVVVLFLLLIMMMGGMAAVWAGSQGG